MEEQNVSQIIFLNYIFPFQAEVMVVSILAAVVGIILIALSVYLCHQHANGLLCQRGDYRYVTFLATNQLATY